MPSLVDRILKLQNPQETQLNKGAFLRGYRNQQTDKRNFAAQDLNIAAAGERNRFDKSMNPMRIATARQQLSFAKASDPLRLNQLRANLAATNLNVEQATYGFDRQRNFQAVGDAARMYRQGADPSQLNSAINKAYGSDINIDGQGNMYNADGKTGVGFNNPDMASTFYTGLGQDRGITPMQQIDQSRVASAFGAMDTQAQSAATRKYQQQQLDTATSNAQANALRERLAAEAALVQAR